MASIYTRPQSPFFWIRFKDEAGKWRAKATGYRTDNLGDQRQAKLLARRMSEEERDRAPVGRGAAFKDWVGRWFEERYGGVANTMKLYRRHWRHLAAWMESQHITEPGQVRYPMLTQYRDQRLSEGTSINTIIHEVKLLGMVMQEAVRRELAPSNPCIRLGWKREKPKEKVPWTDEEFKRARSVLMAEGPEWMLVTLLLGFYQASRLRQCAVPLADIDLEGRRITYRKAKGDKPFTQPLTAAVIPYLEPIIAARRKARKKTLCDIPILPSVEWRVFLDKLGFRHLCHHGLRVSWITRAAQSRGKVSMPEAKRFVNHASTTVHQLYQKLNADDVAHVADALGLPE